MIVTKTSQITGKQTSMELPISLSRMLEWESSGALIQNFFPELTDDQREFLLTGITPEEWDAAFPEEDELSEEDEPAF